MGTRKRRAVFLDRDGCINELVLYRGTGDYEAPYSIEDVHIMPGAIEATKLLYYAGFKLFIVSNQAGYAKGKASLEAHKQVANKIEHKMILGGVPIACVYCCYHHAQGVVPEVSIQCECRKPGTKFLELARDHYDLDMSESWMIGDSDSDIKCGQRAGCRTISVFNPLSASKRLKPISATLIARNLPEAVDKLLAYMSV